MPTLIALFASSVVSYLPSALFGDAISTSAEIIWSVTAGTLTFAVVFWWVKRLRDG